MTTRLMLIALLCAGCGEERRVQAVEETSNPDYGVALLFEIDGYRVYRFVDGRAHYLVLPEGSAITTWTERKGTPKHRRTEYHDDTIETQK